ncbi:MAG: DNA-protecting protein DprA [Candidatus Kerfeldbacteria bacterium CG_4_10_14_0_8_um_filter_42_10]|uniref:DNA-protecting protein DprA n=1 Tax=Candidatus Kerfeldbacteria bacterium CG_4_10_14_0_8_um_filter_42_10 TaxID=2014248 RepID=A0A2M7RKD9_9BACT|nr:MAG: DNA-protecting protein DprA [Candidatus Kerfeldbacteria bacterium CG_4_10_14_0_8_um_filter_42_10]
MSDQIYWNAFNLIPEIGPVTFRKLLNKYLFLQEAWQSPLEELKTCGISSKTVAKIAALRKSVDPIKEWEKLEKNGITVITLLDQAYPSLLKEIYDPPALLYIKGEIKKDDLRLAIVGTRKASSYGQEAASELAGNLAKAGLIIVSGLALGIDALAHQATVQAKGKTIGVLACGLDLVYPRANYRLAEEILDTGGALISEYPLGTVALKHHFPIRNRIISGLSIGTLVIEAGEKSGALITARLALEQNREVFAVPGSIYNKNSEGPNNLIKMGARAVTKAEDILEPLNLKQLASSQEVRKIIADTKEEELILKSLPEEPIHIDQIVRNSGLSAPIVNSTLTLMEMKGKVRNLGGMHYVLAR